MQLLMSDKCMCLLGEPLLFFFFLFNFFFFAIVLYRCLFCTAYTVAHILFLLGLHLFSECRCLLLFLQTNALHVVLIPSFIRILVSDLFSDSVFELGFVYGEIDSREHYLHPDPAISWSCAPLTGSKDKSLVSKYLVPKGISFSERRNTLW